jgi:aspartate racemase
MYSFDYAELEVMLEQNAWELIVERLIFEGLKLKQAGAQLLVLCANTMHLVADEVERGVGLPLVHIAKATRSAVLSHHIKKVLLLGTSYTMGSTLYPSLFLESGIDLIVPNLRDQGFIHRTIYQELIRGIYLEEKREKFLKIMDEAKKDQAIEGVILGCTEIPLLVQQKDTDIPLFNTLHLHVDAIVKAALT